ncbi:putative transcriptional regulator [Acidaminococcus sp. CAG:917]|nr:putative transcriptional regulator [Acidaminococcus sp. CAG:917]
MKKINLSLLNENIIGSSIKEARLAQGISQIELAKKIGVTHAAISYWENGINIPNVLDCWLLADVLGLTIDDLVGRNIET